MNWNDVWDWVKDNPGAVGAGVGSLAALSGVSSSNNQPTGYQGGISNLRHHREQVPYNYAEESRGPGSLGRRYFSDNIYSTPSGVTAQQAEVADGRSVPTYESAANAVSQQAQSLLESHQGQQPTRPSSQPSMQYTTGDVASVAENKALLDNQQTQNMLAALESLYGDQGGGLTSSGNDNGGNFTGEEESVLADWNSFDMSGGYDPYYISRIPWAAAEIVTRGQSPYAQRSAQDPNFMSDVLNFLEANPMSWQDAYRYLGVKPEDVAQMEEQGKTPYDSSIWRGVNSGWTQDQADRLAALYGSDNFGVYNPNGYAAGGIASIAPKGQGYYLGGMTDGMGDQVPAHVDNQEPAALSDGEFVVPADVVSHLGNGNSNAGAKELYAMMERIRKDRTGNPRQGKQVNPGNYLPS